MEKDVRINFRYSEDEYVAAVQWYYFKNQLIRIYILVASIFVCTGLYFLFLGKKPVVGLVLVISGALIYILYVYIVMLNPRKFFKTQSKLKEELFFTFTEEGVLFKFGEEAKNLKWNYYSGYKENKNYFYLIYGKNLFTIIPKRSFKNDAKITKLRKLLNTNFGG
ncbi:YcxB family protein [Clostridium sp.]|uniref:YcxB family protein n=1 Tax=Clostridium sp. TaxID=1506 RepID=UPI003D6D6728